MRARTRTRWSSFAESTEKRRRRRARCTPGSTRTWRARTPTRSRQPVPPASPRPSGEPAAAAHVSSVIEVAREIADEMVASAHDFDTMVPARPDLRARCVREFYLQLYVHLDFRLGFEAFGRSDASSSLELDDS